MIHGKNVVLKVSGIAVAAAQSCDINVEQDFIDTCSPVSGRWKEHIPTTIGWSASIGMLVTNMTNPQAWLNEMKSSASPLTLQYYDTDLNMWQEGSAYIKSWKNGAQVGSLVSFSLQLQGTGELHDPTSVTITKTLDSTYECCEMMFGFIGLTLANAHFVSTRDHSQLSTYEFTLDKKSMLSATTDQAGVKYIVLAADAETVGTMITDHATVRVEDAVFMGTNTLSAGTQSKVVPAGTYTLVAAGVQASHITLSKQTIIE